MNEPIIFYRYENWSQWHGEYSLEERISEHILYAIKETPCGWWIHSDKFYHDHEAMHKEWHLGDKPRWVSKTSRKRFAYPTKEEAIQSFMARKRRQISILSAKLRKAEAALKLAKDGDLSKGMPHELIPLNLSNFGMANLERSAPEVG